MSLIERSVKSAFYGSARGVGSPQARWTGEPRTGGRPSCGLGAIGLEAASGHHCPSPCLTAFVLKRGSNGVVPTGSGRWPGVVGSPTEMMPWWRAVGRVTVELTRPTSVTVGHLHPVLVEAGTVAHLPHLSPASPMSGSPGTGTCSTWDVFKPWKAAQGDLQHARLALSLHERSDLRSPEAIRQ